MNILLNYRHSSRCLPGIDALSRLKLFFLISVLFFAFSRISAQPFINGFLIDFGPNNTIDGNETLSPDIFNNFWNNVTNPVASSIRVKLLNKDGEDSGYEISILEPLSKNGINHGGLLEPDHLFLEEYAINTATQDYFFTASTGSLILRNLNPLHAYRFDFFASRNHPEVRKTRYHLIGANENEIFLQTSGLEIGENGGDGNDSEIVMSDFIFPTPEGEIIIILERFEGSFAYLNAMQIFESNEVQLVSVEDIEIEAAALDVNGGFTSLKAEIIPSDATVKAVEWSINDRDLAFIDEQGRLYGYENATVNVTARSKQINTDINTTTSIEITNQETKKLWLDLGPDDNTTGTATESVESGVIWNNMNDPEVNGGMIDLKYEDGSQSSISISTIQKFLSDGELGEDLPYFSEDLGDFNELSALQDYFYTQNSSSIKISGLNRDNAYRFNILGSHQSSSNRTSRYTLKGINTSTGILTTSGSNLGGPGINANDDDYFTSGLVIPNENGEIEIVLSVASGQYAYLNALRIIEYADVGLCPSRNDFGIAVMGSSVARGQGAPGDRGYAFLYGDYLSQNPPEENTNWTFENVSVGGDNTVKVLNRWERDLLPLCSKYVIYGLSLGNEGVKNNGQEAFDQFKNNMLLIIDKSREAGLTPVIMNNYTRADFGPTEYQFIKDMNLLIHEWDLPSVNLLGAIDDGSGKWATGFQADLGHPNEAGHREFFYAMVPSLFEALDSEKPLPEWQSSDLLEIGGASGRFLEWFPENILHSFTIDFEMEYNGETELLSFENNDITYSLSVDSLGVLKYLTEGNETIIHPELLSLDQKTSITLTHYYAMGKTFLYVNGIPAEISANERLEVKKFAFGASELSSSYKIGQLLLYRSGMNDVEVKSLREGKFLKSSLEIYSPLGIDSSPITANYAQSMNEVQLAFFSSLEETDYDQIKIFPNPAEHKITVSHPQNEISGLSLYDSNGRLVKVSSSANLNISELSNSTYFLHIKMNNEIVVKSFVKL